ncbi:hypothetical protein [Afipia sp. P52-10]|jgi:hypothetical protein|uniref:hypothetical protein n=1 Tax=Afipia sp. P52-10 TaxID=1429916 RepID=UPI0004B4CD26|nr:hypothetical protein [Afipia sp. P52-10]
MTTKSRLIATAVTLAFVGVLGGCSSTPSWDPTDLMDFLDTKKPVPGVRKPVFPEGVPGLAQGVPRELIKGSPEANAAEASFAGNAPPPTEAQPAPAPAAEQHPPPAKRTRTAKRSSRPAAQHREAPVEIAPDDVNVGEQPQSPSSFPAPLPR